VDEMLLMNLKKIKQQVGKAEKGKKGKKAKGKKGKKGKKDKKKVREVSSRRSRMQSICPRRECGDCLRASPTHSGSAMAASSAKRTCRVAHAAQQCQHIAA
jgi:hypothetical protein